MKAEATLHELYFSLCSQKDAYPASKNTVQRPAEFKGKMYKLYEVFTHCFIQSMRSKDSSKMQAALF